ncbi:hypothetical protein SAMN05421796_11055 [Chryseobacterium piscicola]|uniref:Uncharacterized protein n=1 Tax=Chryseobacterium piscicola TaxID=551459 RepID=A0A1N7P0Q9_9FLAO|nr:hypothetical protein [Chryseobacterium piscicola]PQA92761.1 hypothetical protein B0A70_10270 [Chryseobacterium piscicola]SIT04225.1 hypothetical protein SAMN05421796_11055 [Chryseobacterium piscicola]
MIIKKLIRTGICFSVMKSYSYLTKAKYYQNTEYEILVLSEDLRTLQDDDFRLNNDEAETPKLWSNPNGIISRTMTTKEISEFRMMKDDYFTEVFNTVDGIVFELKTRSLKTLFKKSNRKKPTG